MMDRFGDPQLVNHDLLPVAPHERGLETRQLVLFWAAIALSPGIYGFAFLQRRLPVAAALAALVVALVASGLVGWILSRTAARYGIPFAAQSRLAFGARGAPVVLALRWLVGVAFAAAWVLETAVWLRRLLIFALKWRGISTGLLVRGLDWHLPVKGGVAVASWLFALLFLLIGWWVARRGIRSVGRFAIVGLVVSAVTGLGLLVYAGIRSKGFGPWIGRTPQWDPAALITASCAAFGLLVPALVATADWTRFQKRPRVVTNVWGILLAAPAVAFVGAALASAADVVLGRIAGNPIADAASFGHVWAASAGALFSLGIWLAAAPLVGLYSPALALAGLHPSRINHRAALVITAGAAALAVPVIAIAEERGSSWGNLTIALAPVIAILIADELILRRRRLVLEDAYLVRGEYGPTKGFTASAGLALLVGWAFHPGVLPWWGGALAGSFPAIRPFLRAELTAPGAVIAGAVLAGIIYLLGTPLERRLAHHAKKSAVVRQMKREEKTAVRWLGVDADEMDDITNPCFAYNEVPPGKPGGTGSKGASGTGDVAQGSSDAKAKTAASAAAGANAAGDSITDDSELDDGWGKEEDKGGWE